MRLVGPRGRPLAPRVRCLLLSLPYSLTHDIHLYGSAGVIFTILTWLFTFSLTMIVAAASGAVLGERRADWNDPSKTATQASEPAPQAEPQPHETR